MSSFIFISLSPLDLLNFVPLRSMHATGLRAFLKGLLLAKSLTKSPLYFVCLLSCLLAFSNKIGAVVSRDENVDSIFLGSSIQRTTLPYSSSQVYPSQ